MYAPRMNNSSRFVCALAMLALGACGSSGSGNTTADASTADSATSRIDASTIGTPDATVVTTTPDARTIATADATPPVDAAPDATPPDAMVQPVTVTIYDPSTGAPSSGLPVAFLNADNSVVLEVTTDSTGSASAVMTALGSVTVGAAQVGDDNNGNPGNVYTWLGVKPGDVLIANRPATPSSASTITINVTTATFSDPNTSDYETQIFCSDGEEFNSDVTDGGPTAIMISSLCTSAAFFVYAEDGDSDEIGVVYQGSTALTDGANITIGDFTAADNISLMATDLPRVRLETAFQLADGFNGLGSGVGTDGIVSQSGTATATLQLATLPNIDALSNYQFNDNALDTSFNILGRAPSSTTMFSLDFTALMMATVQSEPSYDMASSTFSWSESAGTDDMAVIQIENSSDDASRDFVWTIVGPDTSASFTVPTLPTSLTGFNILSTDSQSFDDAWTVQMTGGYDAIRGAAIGTNNPQRQQRGFEHLADVPSGSQYAEADFED